MKQLLVIKRNKTFKRLLFCLCFCERERVHASEGKGTGRGERESLKLAPGSALSPMQASISQP